MDYYKIRMKLEEELERETSKVSGEMSPSQLCGIKDLLRAIYYTTMIESVDEGMMEEESDYRQRGGNSGGGGNSYSRGRSRNSMGQYNASSRPRYYRDDNKGHLVSTLESMMREAPSDKARDALRQAMDIIETME